MTEKNDKALVPVEGLSLFYQDAEVWKRVKFKADMYAESDFIPARHRGKPASCIMAMEIAHRSGGTVSDLAILQHMYDIKGNPGIDAQLAITFFEGTGKWEPIEYKLDKSTENWKCIAYAKNRETKKVYEGPEVSLEMARKAGWSSRPGSHWTTMPELALRYRAAVFFIRTVAPSALLGLYTREEVIDMVESEPGVHEVPQETVTGKLLDEVAQDAQEMAAEVSKDIKAMEAEIEPEPEPEVIIEAPEPKVEKWLCSDCGKTFEEAEMVGPQCYKCHADAVKEVFPEEEPEPEVVEAEGPTPEDMAAVGEFRMLKTPGMTEYAEALTYEQWESWSPFVQQEFQRLHKKKLKETFTPPQKEVVALEGERPDQAKFWDNFADEMNQLRDRHFSQFGHENYYYDVLGRHGYENLIQVRQEKNEPKAIMILKEVEDELDN